MDLHNPLECPICHNLYSVEINQMRIRTLGCGHSMCTTCLQHLYNSWLSSVTCPMCKFVHKSYSINEIPNNFVMESVIQYQDQITRPIAPSNQIGGFCNKHETKEMFYCDTCNMLICVHCTVLDHPKGDNHKIIDIKEALNNKKSFGVCEIDKDIKKLQVVQTKFSERLQMIENDKYALNNLLKQFEEKMSDLQNIVVESDRLYSWQAQLLKEVQLKINGLSFYKEKVFKIESFKDLATAEVIHTDALKEAENWLKINEKSRLFSELQIRFGDIITRGTSALTAFNASDDLPI